MASNNLETDGMQLINGPLLQTSMTSPFQRAIHVLGLNLLPFFYPLEGFAYYLPRDNQVFLDKYISSNLSISLGTWLAAPSSGPSGSTPGTAIFFICALSLLASRNAPGNVTRPFCAPQLQPANSCPLQKHCFKAVTLLYNYPAIIQKFTSSTHKGDSPQFIYNDAPNTLDALVTANERVQAQNVMDKAVANILLAALGLRLAMESFPIPESWGELDSCGVPPEFVACFSRLKSPSVHSGPRLMLLPLHLSLSLSPILLLIPKSFINKSVSRAWLFKQQMWLHLGSERPDHLGRVERVIWDAVYTVASTPSSLSSALSTLRTELKELGNAPVSHGDLTFFRQLQSTPD
ncbi:hypothetical protein ONZ45_g18403 [Pleurotus djamor]|nr:hypothetical protein ONZ45_g18403 [Pleurotus djamor]